MSPWHVVLVALAGWLNREQQKIIEYLKEENRVLREQLGTKRLRFNDEQRRRLAVAGKELGVKVLRELGCILDKLVLLGENHLRTASASTSSTTMRSDTIRAWTASSSRRPPTSTGPIDRIPATIKTAKVFRLNWSPL